MAEERIIDDDLDKNKKFKIRKNADGEEELYVDQSVRDEEEFEEMTFDVPELMEDDETETNLSPEEYVARERAKREEAELNVKTVTECIQNARTKLEEGDYGGALECAEKAEKIQPRNGAVLALKLRALTHDFAVCKSEEAAKTADGVKIYCNSSEKAELAQLSKGLESQIEACRGETEQLKTQVESKKTERRAFFTKHKNKAAAWFTATVAPMVICLVVAISFGSVMFARQDGVNLILTIVFGSLAAIFFVATLFTANRLWSALKKLSLNENDSSTQLGREYLAKLGELNNLNSIFNSINE